MPLEPARPSPGPTFRRRVERGLTAVTSGFATLGGVALVVIALITVYSIIGRAFVRGIPDFALLSWWRPVRGDFELVELGTAIAIFSFLPYTQLVRGNVLVDFFTAKSSARAKAGFAILANLLLFAIVGLITWRMVVHLFAQQSARYVQTTMLLGIPIWWGYVPAVLAMLLLCVVTAFTVWRSVDEALGEGEPVPA